MRSCHPRRPAISLVPSEFAKRRQHPHTTVFIAIRASSGLLIVHQMRPPTVASVAGGLEAFDYAGVVAAAAGHVVLDCPDLTAAIGGRLGSAALERVDRASGLRARLRDDEGDAALHCELAQVALLASCWWWTAWVAGLGVVIGHGRARARRAGPSQPWSVRTREATRQGRA